MTRKWSMLNYICEIMPTCQTSILRGSLRCGHHAARVVSPVSKLWTFFPLCGIFPPCFCWFVSYFLCGYHIKLQHWEYISLGHLYFNPNNVHNTPANYLLYGFGLWNRSRHCVVLVSLKHCCDYHCSWALTLLVLYRHLSKVQWTIGNVFCFVWW